MLRLVQSHSTDPEARLSQTSTAYATLKRDVLNGRFRPGERLKINDLATSLDVSPGAVREALSRLVPEQLVVSRDQRGFIVAPLSIEDLEDLTNLRCEVEAIALRHSVQRGEDDWESSILATAHRLRKSKIDSTVDRALNPEWVDRHQAFHRALVSACGSPRLLTLHEHLYQQSERYRGLSMHLDAPRSIKDEHQDIVDAALDRNADLLVQLMSHHLRETTRRIVQSARGEISGSAIPE